MREFERNFYFTKNERKGLTAVIVILVLSLCVIWSSKFVYSMEPIPYEVLIFRSCLEAKDEKLVEESKELFTFNPNTLSIDSMLLLPIPDDVAHRIVKYREKVKPYISLSDLEKVYGIGPYLETLKPFVHFHNDSSEFLKYEKKSHSPTNELNDPRKEYNFDKRNLSDYYEVKIDSVENYAGQSKEYLTHVEDTIDSKIVYPTKEEYTSEKMILDVNEANVYELQLINGIGEYYANRIIAFRDKIGGFANLTQLKDLIKRKDSWDKIKPSLTCDPTRIRKRNFNYISKDSLGFIPGIEYKKATIAIRYRDHHFPLNSVEDIKKMKIFTKEEIDLIDTYFSFEE